MDWIGRKIRCLKKIKKIYYNTQSKMKNEKKINNNVWNEVHEIKMQVEKNKANGMDGVGRCADGIE